MSDCKHDDMTVKQLNQAGYGDEVLLGCLCCQSDEIERLERGNSIAADELQKRNQEIERLTAENELITKLRDEAIAMSYEAHDENAALQAKVERLEAMLRESHYCVYLEHGKPCKICAALQESE